MSTRTALPEGRGMVEAAVAHSAVRDVAEQSVPRSQSVEATTSSPTSMTSSMRGSSPTRGDAIASDVANREMNGTLLVPLAVSPRHAARYLGVGHDAICQLLNQGRLRSVRLRRRRLIPMSELQRFLTAELE
jgi:excisionase family DNA binding protein